MLTEPASNTSVPLTVVMRTAVRAAPSAIEPPVTKTRKPESADPPLPDEHQVLPVRFVIVILPLIKAVETELLNPKPVVNEVEVRALALNLAVEPTYPVVVYVVEPVPNCT